MRRTLVTLAVAMAMVASTNAFASVVDLVNNGSGSLNGALYFRSGFQPAGSGFIDSFVRVSAANQTFIQGFNTSARPLQYDENSSPIFTRDLLLSTVGTVTVGGTVYREFILDINQTGSDPLLTLNRVVISLASTNQSSGNVTKGTRLGSSAAGLFPGNDTIVYDSGQGNQIQLNYNLGAG